jgi:hypothetical protein
MVAFLTERESRDLVLVGGYYMPRRLLKDLDDAVVGVKKKLGIPPEEPVRWDPRHTEARAAYGAAGGAVEELRARFIEAVKPLRLRMLVSAVWKKEPGYRNTDWQWAFEAVLQRLSLELNKRRGDLRGPHDYPFLDVVLERLANRKRTDDFLNAYAAAYRNGYSFVTNRLPALRETHACPCMLIAPLRHSPALQAAEVLLGSIEAFLGGSFSGARDERAERDFARTFELFRRAGDETVVGMGLLVRPGMRGPLRRRLRDLGLRG